MRVLACVCLRVLECARVCMRQVRTAVVGSRAGRRRRIEGLGPGSGAANEAIRRCPGWRWPPVASGGRGSDTRRRRGRGLARQRRHRQHAVPRDDGEADARVPARRGAGSECAVGAATRGRGAKWADDERRRAGPGQSAAAQAAASTRHGGEGGLGKCVWRHRAMTQGLRDGAVEGYGTASRLARRQSLRVLPAVLRGGEGPGPRRHRHMLRVHGLGFSTAGGGKQTVKRKKKDAQESSTFDARGAPSVGGAPLPPRLLPRVDPSRGRQGSGNLVGRIMAWQRRSLGDVGGSPGARNRWSWAKGWTDQRGACSSPAGRPLHATRPGRATPSAHL